MMETLFSLYREGVEALAQAGNKEAELDARQLLLEAFHMDAAHFLMERMQPLSEEAETKARISSYRRMIEKRSRKIPLQHILGSQEFMGLSFRVSPAVLIPRQDTETLVEQVLSEFPDCQKNQNLRLLDLCTGSGCIAISLGLKGRFGRVTAADLSFEALAVARENAERLQADRRKSETVFTFCQGDLFSALPEESCFDVIVSNPPYIPRKVIETLEPEVRDYEPMMALDGDEDGLCFYRRIAAEAGAFLSPGGRIYLEIGHDQGPAVKDLLEVHGFENVCVIKDLPGKDRVVRAEWPV